jgi:hypothetical protein
MAKYQIESGACHGRGFSAADPLGYMAKFTSWVKRPAANASPQTFTTDYTTDIVTASGHGYVTGDSVMLTTTTTLPGGLAVSTEYYIIYINANTFYLASTYDNAKAGTKIDLLSNGTGTHSVYKLGGGAGWYIHDDKSVVASKTFTVNTSTEELTIAAGHTYGLQDIVWVSSSGTLPTGLSAGTNYYVIYVSSTVIKLASSLQNAITGTAINISSAGSGTLSIIAREKYIVVCDTLSPAVNDYNTSPSGGAPKFIKIGFADSEAGSVRAQPYLWWNATTHCGYGLWAGKKITTSDDADFSYDFRGGDECMFIQSRIGTSWTCFYLDEFTGDVELLKPSTQIGVLQSGVTAGTSVVLQLDTGEAANFVINDYCFIIDMQDHSWVNCVKITNTDTGTDQITVDTISQNFPAGAIVGSYPHRYVSFGNYTDTVANFNYASRLSKLPYINTPTQARVFHDQYSSISGTANIEYAPAYLARMAPRRNGSYATIFPGICEGYWENDVSGGNNGGNEAYGTLKNIIASPLGTMAAGQDGRVDSGKNYLFFLRSDSIANGGLYSIASCLLDTESTT